MRQKNAGKNINIFLSKSQILQIKSQNTSKATFWYPTRLGKVAAGQLVSTELKTNSHESTRTEKLQLNQILVQCQRSMCWRTCKYRFSLETFFSKSARFSTFRGGDTGTLHNNVFRKNNLHLRLIREE